MRPADQAEADRLGEALDKFGQSVKLPGIGAPGRRDVLIEQIVESQRRNRYIEALRQRDLSASSAAADSGNFDPLMAAILQAKSGNFEEACWLVFLYVHFGKHKVTGWKYARDVYSRLGQGGAWDWPTVRENVSEFRDWLDANRLALKTPGERGGFGNHRKYESLAGWTPNGTGEVVASYVDLITQAGSHAELFAELTCGRPPEEGFESLYRKLSRVRRFGRTAAFDYLMMISKLHLADIVPGHCYLEKATGPLTGAQLLFGSSGGQKLSAADLRAPILQLEEHLQVGYDVLEDALCNWQKSPAVFRPFRG